MKYFDLAQAHRAAPPSHSQSITSGYTRPKDYLGFEAPRNGIIDAMNVRLTCRLAGAFLVLFSSQLGATTLSGSIVDADGQPIEGAAVTVGESIAYVDGDGHFHVQVTPGDVYPLIAAAPGYYPMLQTFTRSDLEPRTVDRIPVGPISLVQRKPERRLLAFGGDAMLGRRFVEPRANEVALVRSGSELEDMKAILRHVKPYLELADFASVNLETQLSEAPLSDRLPKSVTFLTHPAIAKALKWAGFDYVALGNNHTFDYQEQGLQQTLRAVSAAELAWSGAGADDREARAAALVDAGGQALRLLSYVGWAGSSVPSQVAEANKGGAAFGTAAAIEEDLGGADGSAIDILQYHSGLEYVSYPPVSEETQLKLAIDAGADLAIGHHSHVLQGFEIYRDKLIAYSLGNFVFDQYIPSTHSSMLLFAWYDGDEFVRAEIVPLHINGYVPTPASGAIRYDILQRLARLSESASTCVAQSGGHLVVEACDDSQHESQTLTWPESAGGGDVFALRDLGASPVRAVAGVDADTSYRLGIDLLRRGDFEYVGLFDTADRTWIDHPSVTAGDAGRREMTIDVATNEPVRTGMRVFARVFTRSAPATLTGIMTAEGCSEIEFAMQRRRDGWDSKTRSRAGPSLQSGRPRSITLQVSLRSTSSCRGPRPAVSDYSSMHVPAAATRRP